MNTYKSKIEAQNKASELNKEIGYSLYNPYFIGESLVNMEGVPSKGWYLINKETKKHY